MVHFFSDALLTTALCPNRIPRKAMNYMQAAGFLAAVKCAVRCARRSVVVVVQPACTVRWFFVAVTVTVLFPTCTIYFEK